MTLCPLLLLILVAAPPVTAIEPLRSWEHAYARLLQVEEDYAEYSEDPTEEGLKELLLTVDELQTLAHALGAEGSPLAREVESLRQGLESNTPPMSVWVQIQRMYNFIRVSGRTPEAPQRKPDHALGRSVYAQLCVACHGPAGDLAKARVRDFKPPASDFLQSDVMNPLSPLRAWYATTYGEYGTAMPSFPTLSDHERWSVAFYLFTLRLPECRKTPVHLPLKKITQATDNDLAASYSEAELACIRWSALSGARRPAQRASQPAGHR